jgi:ABC-type cobalamin transport system ATPase subunit
MVRLIGYSFGMADIADTIETVAGQPKEVQVDGQIVKSQDLEQLIRADQYLKSKEAASKKTSGMRFVKLSQPSSV